MLRILVTNERQKLDFEHADGPLELGRGPQRDVPRLIIEDAYLSRDQMRIESLGERRVRISNLGGPLSITNQPALADSNLEETALRQAQEIATGEEIELKLPVRIAVGYSIIDIRALRPEAPAGPVASMQTLSRPIRASALATLGASRKLNDLGDTPSPELLTEWFERLLQVQQAAAGSDQFYQETAQAVVELIGLDRGLVMLRRDDQRQWEMVARFARREPRGPEFSRKVLEQVIRDGRTFFQGLKQQDQMQSLAGVEAVVASPIFDEDNNPIGVVYGCREMDSPAARSGIKPLEAQVVQLLAAAVSAGLARVQREAEAARARVQFEQFFSRELARELERNPNMLQGQQREVTALFCDLRSFSRISEKLGAAEIYRLLHDVMDALTNCVMAAEGVVIDYHGDGMAAMWNAPVTQSDHAAMACQAALEMQQAVPALSAQWEPALGFPLRIGIGLNTGSAQVGNAGSSQRMKYGPLGHTVNLASRVEGATKQFGVDVLVSEATQRALTASFATRRLCRVRVVGIQGDVAIHELRQSPGDANWQLLCEQYERSLELFEAGKLEEAQESLRRILGDARFRDDRASRVLLDNVEAALTRPVGERDPIIELSSK